jgi:group I intron endonuclease
MVGIYKITNPKGRVYIGQSILIESRWNSYKSLNCENQVRLFRSLQKYGISEHIFEVVEECAFEELNIKERHWQDFYNVLGEKGLNCKLTGTADKSGQHSEASKEKMVKTRTGQKRGPQTSEHITKRVAHTKGKTYEEIHGTEKAKELRENKKQKMLGKKTGPCSEERRKRISQARIGNSRLGTHHSDTTIQKMKKPKEKVKCPHCGQIGGNSQMTRWHFENCRNKTLQTP